MVSNRPGVMDDQSVLQKPAFFFGDTVLDDLTYQKRCFQFSYLVNGEEKTATTQSTFDCTVSNMSLSPSCPKREDPPSWVERTNVIKTGIFVGGPLGYAEKSPTHMDMLMPIGGYPGSDCPSIDLRPVGLGIIKGDDSNWIKPFWLSNQLCKKGKESHRHDSRLRLRQDQMRWKEDSMERNIMSHEDLPILMFWGSKQAFK